MSNSSYYLEVNLLLICHLRLFCFCFLFVVVSFWRIKMYRNKKRQQRKKLEWNECLTNFWNMSKIPIESNDHVTMIMWLRPRRTRRRNKVIQLRKLWLSTCLESVVARRRSGCNPSSAHRRPQRRSVLSLYLSLPVHQFSHSPPRRLLTLSVERSDIFP